MTAADGILAVLTAAAVVYAVLGGADFGGGVWDLLARGPRRDAQRALVARAMGPVWEANHVWLVFLLIGAFSGFPLAFGQLVRLLAIPLALALLGLVLRGSAFALRQYGGEGPGAPVRGTRAWGRVFGLASLATPALLGACAGIAATGGAAGAFPLVTGLLALACCAYVAAAFLCREAHLAGEPDLARDFRRRALVSGAAAGALALAALPLLTTAEPGLAARLTGRALGLVIVSGVAGLAGLALVARHRYGLAVCAAAGAVGAVVAGWAIASYPVLVPPGLTVAQAAGPAGTGLSILVVLMVGFGATLPAFFLTVAHFLRPGDQAIALGTC